MPNIGFWAAAGAGGGGGTPAYELISTTVLGSSAASVTFDVSTLSATYKHLQLRYVALGTSASYRNRLRLNADTGANYSTHLLYGNGSSVASAAGTSTTEIALGTGTNTTNVFTVGIVDLLDAYSTAKNKTVRALNGVVGNEIALTSGAWLSTSATTSVSMRPDAGSFVTGSRFSLYGVRG